MASPCLAPPALPEIVVVAPNTRSAGAALIVGAPAAAGGFGAALAPATGTAATRTADRAMARFMDVETGGGRGGWPLGATMSADGPLDPAPRRARPGRCRRRALGRARARASAFVLRGLGLAGRPRGLDAVRAGDRPRAAAATRHDAA